MPTTFPLSHAGLERIFKAWSIPLPASSLILFGLRGCLPRPAPARWSRILRLEPAAIDHVHMRCTLGIWDRQDRRIYAAPASTVPHRDNVERAAARGGKGANQIEPGYYPDLAKGEHLQGKLNGHQALRQTAGRFYRRSPAGLPYSSKSPLFFGNPYDNLHCGWNEDGLLPGFRSAGCLVVAGLPHCPRHERPHPNQGPWKTFHHILYGSSQKTFPILILPAAEAQALLAEGEDRVGTGTESRPRRRAAKPRLVFGSKGEGVKALQKKLSAAGFYKGPANGEMGIRTYRAWNESGFTRL